MFLHNLKYALKTLLKSKALIFWTLAFPIILATLFQMAFQNIENSEKLDTIKIAIVNTNNQEAANKLSELLTSIENEGTKLFSITRIDQKKAEEQLEAQNISGYLIIDDTIKIMVRENGINSTILKYTIEQILQTAEIIKNIIKEDQSSILPTNQFYQNIQNEIEKQTNMVKLENISNNNLSYTLIEFYTLIAMTCLYGGILGLHTMNQSLADQSVSGKRIAISPTKKSHIIFSSALAGYIIQLMTIALLFLYTTIILKINYGENLPLIVLLTLVGCLAGLSMGILIASTFKTTENTKTGIIISITMLGCFLSGMMGITMKYIIDKNIPILNRINPANMITDGFYSLYYYDTTKRYYFNIISLVIFTMIMILLSTHNLRRQKYDNI